MNQTTKTVFSAAGKLVKIDWQKILNGLIIGLLGGLLTFLQSGAIVKAVDFSGLGQFAAAAFSVATILNGALVNLVRKLIANTTYINKQ